MAYEKIIELLDRLFVKYTVHHFPSGASMLDIWNEEKFYVLQFEDNLLGWSEITDENSGFDTTPDETFYDVATFVDRIALLLTTEG